METFKKHWIMYLGIGFIFLAILYFLKMAIELSLVPPEARVALGLILGTTGVFFGYNMGRKTQSVKSQIVAGLGTAVMYATFAYASFSEELLWSSNALIIAMIAVNAAVTYIGVQYKMRILIFISVLGGLMTPLIVQAHESHVWMLFFYVLVINIVAIYLSAYHKWKELRIMSFLMTVFIYISYYFIFDPQHWGEPMFYLGTLFFTYLAGLILASWYDEQRFDGVNMYLSLVNAINFVFWSIFILDSFDVAYAFPAIFTGFLFIATSVLINKVSPKSSVATAIYFIVGVLIIAIATGDLGYHYATRGMRYVVTSSVWLFLIVFVFGASSAMKNKMAQNLSVVAWIILLVYWFSHAWRVDWVEWFGVEFIPFLNPGALVWMGLAAMGFTFSRHMARLSELDANAGQKIMYNRMELLLAIVGHVVIGGLFTVQIQNTWDAYHIHHLNEDIVMSAMWMLYALCIFLWGAYSREKLFRILGSTVLLFATAKVLVHDLGESTTTQKAIFLMIMGLMTLSISYINNKWTSKEEILTTNDESFDEVETQQSGKVQPNASTKQ